MIRLVILAKTKVVETKVVENKIVKAETVEADISTEIEESATETVIKTTTEIATEIANKTVTQIVTEIGSVTMIGTKAAKGIKQPRTNANVNAGNDASEPLNKYMATITAVILAKKTEIKQTEFAESKTVTKSEENATKTTTKTTTKIWNETTTEAATQTAKDVTIVIVRGTKISNAIKQLSEKEKVNAGKDASGAGAEKTTTITPMILAKTTEIEGTKTVEAETAAEIEENSTETAPKIDMAT